MKKMYKKPITENMSVVSSTMVCVSPGVDNTEHSGTQDKPLFGNAPGRHRNTLIVK